MIAANQLQFSQRPVRGAAVLTRTVAFSAVALARHLTEMPAMQQELSTLSLPTSGSPHVVTAQRHSRFIRDRIPFKVHRIDGLLCVPQLRLLGDECNCAYTTEGDQGVNSRKMIFFEHHTTGKDCIADITTKYVEDGKKGPVYVAQCHGWVPVDLELNCMLGAWVTQIDKTVFPYKRLAA